MDEKTNFISKIIQKKEQKGRIHPPEINTMMFISGAACALSALWFVYLIPLLIAIALLGYQYYLFNLNNTYFKANLTQEKEKSRLLEIKIEELDTDKRRAEIKSLKEEKEHVFESIKQARIDLADTQEEYNKLLQEVNIKKAAIDAEIELEKTKKQEQVKKEAQKISRFREMYKSIKYSIDNFFYTIHQRNY